MGAAESRNPFNWTPAMPTKLFSHRANYASKRINEVDRVYNQQSLGISPVCAVLHCFQILYKQACRNDKAVLNPLILYIHTCERFNKGPHTGNPPVSILEAAQCFQEEGGKYYDEWDYEVEQWDVLTQRSRMRWKKEKVFARAVENVLSVEVFDIRHNLLKNCPIMCGISVFRSCMDNSGKMRATLTMPQTGEQPLGGLAVVLTHYDSKMEMVTFLAPFGKDWGNKGTGIAPIQYVLNYGADFLVMNLSAELREHLAPGGSDDDATVHIN